MRTKLLSTSALALAMALSFAAVQHAQAQANDSQASQDAKKKADDQKLTPQRPMRNVGPDRANQAQQQPATSSQAPSSTTGQGTSENSQPAQTQNQPATNSATQNNAAQPSTQQPQQNAAQPNAQQNAAQPNAQQNAAQQPAAQPQNTAQQPNAQPQQNATAGANANGRVALNATQQRQLSTSLRSANITPVTNVNFSLTVGTAVPADVRLTPVTTQIVAVLPQYRGYSFFATREEIVIVEPTSKQIVALVPVQASAATTESATTTATMKRTEGAPPERRHVVKRAQPRHEVIEERDVTVGQSEPDTVIIERRPRPHGFWPFFWWD